MTEREVRAFEATQPRLDASDLDGIGHFGLGQKLVYEGLELPTGIIEDHEPSIPEVALDTAGDLLVESGHELQCCCASPHA
jgi:hypothetical protein